MIEFSKTIKIDDKMLFEDIADFIFNMDIYDDNRDYISMVCALPKDTQRLIFAKMGAMMIDYAGSEDF